MDLILDQSDNEKMKNSVDTVRLDKWLWFARFCKTRTQANKFCREGNIRVNRELVAKPNHLLKPEDVLSFILRKRILIIRVISVGTRRGPFSEAKNLYQDLSGSDKTLRNKTSNSTGIRAAGSGRPTKRERRAIDQLNDPFK